MINLMLKSKAKELPELIPFRTMLAAFFDLVISLGQKGLIMLH